ncbi:MAG TPA: hypothetical protein PLW65_11140 [Pseudomonadota bacterium]|nr:hypothetical protein [Pseudomonadota bacterium]
MSSSTPKLVRLVPVQRALLDQPSFLRAFTVAARRAGLGLDLVLGLVLLGAAGCGAVGKGPDVNTPPDLGRPADMTSISLCSAKNCAGCCQGDVCQPGITAAACGGAGAICSQCSAAQKCSPDLRCVFDQNAVWLVAAVRAQISLTNPDGFQWRTDGSMPQPLVQFDANNRTSSVAIVVSGSPPVWTATWNQGFLYTAQDLTTIGFDLQAFDQPSGMPLKPMSDRHHITLNQQDFITKNLTYQGWEGVKSLTITLQRQ